MPKAMPHSISTRTSSALGTIEERKHITAEARSGSAAGSSLVPLPRSRLTAVYLGSPPAVGDATLHSSARAGEAISVKSPAARTVAIALIPPPSNGVQHSRGHVPIPLIADVRPRTRRRSPILPRSRRSAARPPKSACHSPRAVRPLPGRRPRGGRARFSPKGLSLYRLGGWLVGGWAP